LKLAILKRENKVWGSLVNLTASWDLVGT